jgi:hypothetical protein
MAQRRKLVFDAEARKTPVGPENAPREVEARMGQYLAAFGSGAGDTHISRRVIDALRYRYLPCIQEMVAVHPEAWKSEGAHVLALMRGVGRIAASLAQARGEITITPWDAWQAAGQVERAEFAMMGRTGNCPPAPPPPPVGCAPAARRR